MARGAGTSRDTGEVPQLVASLLEEAFGRNHGWLLLVGTALVFWSVAISALFLTKALNAVFAVQETRPLWGGPRSP
jgi:hypothetical protein